MLLPSDGAVLSPEWLPWDQRLRAGDLGVGDLLPTRADDPRLVPSWSAGDDDLDFSEPDETTSLLRDVGLEIGLGRVRVLSQYGRLDAADRWYAGEAGPDSPMAKAAAATWRGRGRPHHAPAPRHHRPDWPAAYSREDGFPGRLVAGRL